MKRKMAKLAAAMTMTAMVMGTLTGCGGSGPTGDGGHRQCRQRHDGREFGCSSRRDRGGDSGNRDTGGRNCVIGGGYRGAKRR